MTLALFIQWLAGAVGGNVAGGLLEKFDLGPVGNTLAGLVGGIGGCQLLATMAPGLGAAVAGGGLDIVSLASQIAGGGVGGALLMMIAGLVKQALAGAPLK